MWLQVIHGKIFGLPVETFSTAGLVCEILYKLPELTLPKISTPSLCRESIYLVITSSTNDVPVWLHSRTHSFQILLPAF